MVSSSLGLDILVNRNERAKVDADELLSSYSRSLPRCRRCKASCQASVFAPQGQTSAAPKGEADCRPLCIIRGYLRSTANLPMYAAPGHESDEKRAILEMCRFRHRKPRAMRIKILLRPRLDAGPVHLLVRRLHDVNCRFKAPGHVPIEERPIFETGRFGRLKTRARASLHLPSRPELWRNGRSVNLLRYNTC
jgi:hypothetical protein